MKHKYVLTDGRMPRNMLDALRSFGFTPVSLTPRKGYDEPISAHPDIFAFTDGRHIWADGITVAELLAGVDPDDADKLSIHTVETINDSCVRYPYDCSLNAARCGQTLIGRTDVLRRELCSYAEEIGMKLLSVRQGYAKCNICAIPNGVITEDAGIAEACRQAGLDVLLINEHAVRLDGYGYGFIGGASGYHDGTVYFCGAIETHPSYERISAFLTRHGCRAVSLGRAPLYDHGSLLFIDGG